MDILQATFHWLLQPQHWTGDAGILLRLREHLYYVLISIVVASAIALPLCMLSVAAGEAVACLVVGPLLIGVLRRVPASVLN